MHTPRSILMALLLAAGLSACATQSLDITVDGISSQAAPPNKHYLWRSGMPDVSANDLYFREFSRYFQTLLADRGYELQSGDEAPVVIYFHYGVSPGRTTQYTTSMPIYDIVGGDTIVVTETQTDASGKVTGKTTRAISTPLRTRVVGVSMDTQHYTEYTSFAILEAKRYEPGRKPAEMQTLWRTTINTTGPSNDLRALMPVMAATAAPYLGVNTGAAKRIEVKPDDPAATALKQRVLGK